MQLQVQLLTLGVTKGIIYGLIALGLVLVYKGTRVLNFAQPEIGVASVYVAYLVSGRAHAPYWLGALAALTFAVTVGLLFERLVVRQMAEASRLSVAVATIALFSLLLSGELLIFGPSPYVLPDPVSGQGVDVGGVQILPVQLLSMVVLPVVCIALAAFLRYTDFGLGVLAAAQDSTAVRLVGVRLSRVSAFTWATASALSAVAALLIEPVITVLAPGEIGTPLFVGGLAAALVGGLSSLPGAIAGGLLVGILEAEVTHYVTATTLRGAPTLAIFLVIVAFLVLRPQGLLARSAA